MSLGLFNCRLIQSAGDQLFFFAGCLAPVPVRGKLCSASVLLDPDQREGAECLLFFLLRKVLFGFSTPAPQSDAGGFTPTDSATNSRRSTKPTHRFCYRALIVACPRSEEHTSELQS